MSMPEDPTSEADFYKLRCRCLIRRAPLPELMSLSMIRRLGKRARRAFRHRASVVVVILVMAGRGRLPYAGLDFLGHAASWKDFRLGLLRDIRGLLLGGSRKRHGAGGAGVMGDGVGRALRGLAEHGRGEENPA